MTNFKGIRFPEIRRVGADHYTEHDFKMERIGGEQNAKTYAERLAILEAHGWVPFSSPFYYANREFHGGHHPPGTKKYVPTSVAFAMFKEQHPEVELPRYKPHPHGWIPPTAPAPLVKQELVSLEPMKEPSFSLRTMEYEYGTEEQKRERRERKARLDAVFEGVEGVRSYGFGLRGQPLVDYVHVTLEAEKHRPGIPDTWEEMPVEVTVKSEAQEKAERAEERRVAQERYDEEAAWLAKANGGRRRL